jgi:hypothetical protein
MHRDADGRPTGHGAGRIVLEALGGVTLRVPTGRLWSTRKSPKKRAEGVGSPSSILAPGTKPSCCCTRSSSSRRDPHPTLIAKSIRLGTLLGVLLGACSGTQAAPGDGARVLFVAGTVTATTRAGTSEVLERGGAWRQGQVLRAARDGRAQVRFPDGTLLSVSPGAHVRLDEFRYDGKGGRADLASFSVLRGSARIMAGTQRTARSALRIGTPAAVMEAGTAEVAVAVSGGSVQVRVGRGQVELRNDAGRLSAGAGQRAFVKDRATPPMLMGTIVPAPITPPAR